MVIPSSNTADGANCIGLHNLSTQELAMFTFVITMMIIAFIALSFR